MHYYSLPKKIINLPIAGIKCCLSFDKMNLYKHLQKILPENIQSRQVVLNRCGFIKNKTANI